MGRSLERSITMHYAFGSLYTRQHLNMLFASIAFPMDMKLHSMKRKTLSIVFQECYSNDCLVHASIICSRRHYWENQLRDVTNAPGR